MIYKRCSRCGKRIPEGEKCGCIKKRHTDYDKNYRDKKATEFYHSRQWQQARENALNLDGGIDVYLYMTTGEIKLADTVHHIESLRDAWEKRLSLDNLMSLNHDTHSSIERLYVADKQGTMERLKRMLSDYRNSGRGYQ